MSYQAKNPRNEKRESTLWRKSHPNRLCVNCCLHAAERNGGHQCYAEASFHFKEPLDRHTIGQCRSFMMREVMPCDYDKR